MWEFNNNEAVTLDCFNWLIGTIIFLVATMVFHMYINFGRSHFSTNFLHYLNLPDSCFCFIPAFTANCFDFLEEALNLILWITWTARLWTVFGSGWFCFNSLKPLTNLILYVGEISPSLRNHDAQYKPVIYTWVGLYIPREYVLVIRSIFLANTLHHSLPFPPSYITNVILPIITPELNCFPFLSFCISNLLWLIIWMVLYFSFT